jgi:D-amino-acid dehydrogenase
MELDQQQTIKATVIGGGIVGVCNALYLQREGFDVTLIEPNKAGDSTAKWSCGQMAVSEVIPLSKPGILKKIPIWLLDQKSPLALRPQTLPSLLPWFWRFLLSAKPSKIHEIANDLVALTSHVYEDYAPLLEACDDATLLGERPILQVFDTESGLHHERDYYEFKKGAGFSSSELNERDIAELEPALAGKFRHGLLLSDWRAVKDTEGFIQALTDSFLRQGGTVLTASATQITFEGTKATGVSLSDGRFILADHIVLSAGNGSKAFFKQLGINPPLRGITGYQIVLPTPNVEIKHSVIYSDGGFCFAPMTRGLQIGGTIEFASEDAKPNLQRADIILEKAKRILPNLNTQQHEYGVGHRPFLPDTKPVIDRSKRFSNVYFAFGHGQLGLTLGATTGKLIADLATNRTPSIDLTPYRVDRF